MDLFVFPVLRIVLWGRTDGLYIKLYYSSSRIIYEPSNVLTWKMVWCWHFHWQSGTLATILALIQSQGAKKGLTLAAIMVQGRPRVCVTDISTGRQAAVEHQREKNNTGEVASWKDGTSLHYA